MANYNNKAFDSVDKKTILEFNNMVRELGNFPFDRHDPNVLDVVKTHCDEYRKLCLEYGVTPTWEGISLALGKPRHTVTQWRDGATIWAKEKGVTEYLQAEWAWLNSILTTSMIDGSVDRVTGIFYARNNYGYTNDDVETKKTEVSVHLSMQELIDGAKNLQLAQQTAPAIEQKDKKVVYTQFREKEPARKKKKPSALQMGEELTLDF